MQLAQYHAFCRAEVLLVLKVMANETATARNGKAMSCSRYSRQMSSLYKLVPKFVGAIN
jgi:hypothetical protein